MVIWGLLGNTHNNPPKFKVIPFLLQILSFYRQEPLRPQRKNLIPLTDEYLIRVAVPPPFSAHLCLTAAARGHESQPFNLTGASPLCCEVQIRQVDLL